METNSCSNSKIHLGALSALGFWLQNVICHEFEPHSFFGQEKRWDVQAPSRARRARRVGRSKGKKQVFLPVPSLLN